MEALIQKTQVTVALILPGDPTGHSRCVIRRDQLQPSCTFQTGMAQWMKSPLPLA
jgi:hypothetical protein